ncbi:amidohydrolase [Gilvimarinus agarilyticus]|uniref:amidohydrolase n=1 Tax=unclassified Gilvimarinus TaxID=2642066 RepID=UPI001C082288|nr:MULTISPECIES: amidohydrolase [unclassified Gilvimarinus]MBU2885070.1 amidohydrolase [Gilvimarinus agarilyticus]MDO6569967.1 amidohydrolase [Gilvimarinus sp. 2_MG-2023]MDO6747233.1 amidohydrolase [Gilvimarinus sp. 1_MG-2023]
MQDLTVALLQNTLAGNEPALNRQRFADLMPSSGAADLIVLPEVFTTGFHPKARLSADVHGAATCQWFLEQAALRRAVVTGSIVMQTPEQAFVNRMLWACPEGSLSHYDKRHLFRMADEHKRYQAGTERVIETVAGWRILLQVCYDLRFPVFSRSRNDYDAIIYVANWPEARHEHWRALLQARAIENLSYVIGVNRVGVDAYDQPYAGGSVVFGPDGECLLDAGDQIGCHTYTLSAEALAAYRQRFPADLDSDDFTLHL